MRKVYQPMRIGLINTSETEIRDLIKAWAAISLAFAILFTEGLNVPALSYSFFISAITVGIGFVFHELGHKLVAQKYGCFAEFRADNTMLVVAIIMSFFGFILAAPGAVIINGPVGKNRNGKISAAGPLVNFFLAVIFAILPVFFGPHIIFTYGFTINALLGLFNLIPFGMFDGKKILAWNKGVYGFMVVWGVALFLVGQLG